MSLGKSRIIINQLVVQILIILLVALWVQSAFAGNNFWSNIGHDGGRVLSIAIDHKNPEILYAGTYEGGTFKSVDGGETWTGMNDAYHALSTDAIAVDPVTTSTVYSTGQKSMDGGLTWNKLAMPISTRSIVINPKSPETIYITTYSDMIYKSTDSGANWTLIGYGESIALDPVDPQVVYAGGSSMQKSLDGGQTWTSINPGLASSGISAIAVDPTNSTIVYAAGSGSVFKSFNGGTTWANVTGSISDLNFTSLAISPTNSEIIYATSYYYSGSKGGVYKSIDGGGTWSKYTTGMVDDPLFGYAIDCLALDPVNPDIIYAGSWFGGTLYKSIDGGLTWSVKKNGLSNVYVSALATSSATPGTVYSGTDYGLFKSLDRGNTWVLVSDAVVRSDVLKVDPGNSDDVYSLDYNSIRKSTDGGASWSALTSGLPTAVHPSALEICAQQPSVLLMGTGSYGDFYPAAGIFKSIDGGQSWAAVNTGLTDLAVESVGIDPANSQRLYAGTVTGGLFKSVDGGATWSAANNGLTELRVTKILINPNTTTTLYLVTNEIDKSDPYVWKSIGRLYMSSDSGEHWTEITNNLPEGGIVDLILDPDNACTLYVAIDDFGVYVTRDSGMSWSAMNNSLPMNDLNCLAMDVSSPITIYAGDYGKGIYSWTVTPGPHALSFTKDGSGSGIVSSTPTGIACDSTCSAQFDHGTSVSLYAEPAEYSIFSGWSGSCSGTGDCQILMDSDKSATATFTKDTMHMTRIDGTTPIYSSTLQAAYNAAVAGSTISVWGTDFTENLNANINKHVTLKGGYNSAYTSNDGYSRLRGVMVVGRGSLTVENFEIQ